MQDLRLLQQWGMAPYNVKVKFPLLMPRKYKRGAEIWLHSFLTSSLDGGVSAYSLPGNHCIGGWVGPKTRSGLLGNRKIS